MGRDIDDIAKRYLERVPEQLQRVRLEKFGKSFHITIATKQELDDAKVSVNDITDNVTDIVALGLGSASDGPNVASFVVIFSLQLSEIRNRLLGQEFAGDKDFHITLGYAPSDVHTKGKGVHSLIPPFDALSKDAMDAVLSICRVSSKTKQVLQKSIEVVNFCLQQTDIGQHVRRAKLLDTLCMLYLSSEEPAMALSCAEELVSCSQLQGLVRKCQTLKALDEPVLANFSGLQALKIAISTDAGRQGDKVMSFLSSTLTSLDCPVDSRCLFETHATRQNDESNPWKVRDNDRLVEIIHSEFTEQLWEHSVNASTTRRNVFNPVTKSIQTLPRFFSWIVPQRLCGMSTPRNAQDIQVLEHGLNVGLVVSLTIESPLPESWFSSTCKHVFLPVDNYEPPTISQVDEFVILASATMLRKKAVLVHCGGGKGRAGSMIACWLTRMGLFGWEDTSPGHMCVQCSENGSTEVLCNNEGCAFTRLRIVSLLQQRGWNRDDCFGASEAIETLRRWRPGSLETKQQEDFIHVYASELWRRMGENQVEPEVHASNDDDRTRQPYECAPKFAESTLPLITMRANGSQSINSKGKKLPSLIVAVGLPGSGKSTLASLLGSRVTVVSGDEAGGREAVERAIGVAIKSGQSLFVDRCHVDKQSRARVLDLAFRPADACAVFLDLDKDECIKRVDSRIDHPTVESGSGRGVVETFAKMVQIPDCTEGFAKVYHVRSKHALRDLLEHEFNVPLPKQLGDDDKPRKVSTGEEDDHSPVTQRLPGFTKFPRTAHLLKMSDQSVSRDDLVIASASTWLAQANKPGCRITVEEKIDGANLGVSVDPETREIRIQNRSHYVNSKDHPQFAPLNEWKSLHQAEVFSLLASCGELYPDGTVNPILFGEWIVAKHSIHYNAIPDYFAAFDILLPNGKFASRKLFMQLMEENCPTIARVPTLFDSENTLITIDMLSTAVKNGKSKFIKNGQGSLEGVYVRVDENDFLKERAKIVRADFISGNDHWSKHTVERNVKLFN